MIPGSFEVTTPIFDLSLFKLLFSMRENVPVYLAKCITIVVNKVTTEAAK